MPVADGGLPVDKSDKVMKHLLLCVIVSLILPLAVVGQRADGGCSVSGVVVDSLSAEPVVYATVLVYGAGGGGEPVRSVLTDDDGRFDTGLPGEGGYRLTVSMLGKVTAVRDFTARGRTDLGTLRLAEDVELLDEVAVTAKKPLVRVEAGKIAYSVEDDPQAASSTASEMLRKVPMLSVDGDGNVSLAGSTNFKVYVNGRPNTMMSNNAKEVLKSMPASTIKKVEVITHPGAKYDAEGVGGIINIVTTGATLEGYNVSLAGAYTNNNGYQAHGYGTVKVGRLSLAANYGYARYNSWPVSLRSELDYLSPSPVAKATVVSDNTNVEAKAQFATLEASFEIDSLNLLSLTGNYYDVRQDVFMDAWSDARDVAGGKLYGYGLGTATKSHYGTANLSLDYQHLSPRREGETFVFSYRMDNTPIDADNMTRVFATENYTPYEQWQTSDGRSLENTFQADYTLPLDTMHTLNVGAKYIYRINDSHNTDYRRRTSGDEWAETGLMGSGDNLHRQHVLGIYGEYGLKYKQFGLRLGLRYEYTRQSVAFDDFRDKDFGASFSDVVPSLLLSYTVGGKHSLSLGYNMRISRPGISYLNPFRNSGQTPLYVEYGNPDLDTERYNVVTLNYSYFAQDITVGAELRYTQTGNGITHYSFVDGGGVVNSTYANIGISHIPHLTVFANWNIGGSTRINCNAGFGYERMRTNGNAAADGITAWDNDGWAFHAVGGVEQNLPWRLTLTVNAGANREGISLYSMARPVYYWYGLSLQRKFLKDDRLSLQVSASTFAPKYDEYRYSSRATDCISTNIQRMRMMQYAVSLTYTFGELKAKVKKTSRTIVNDDVVGGASK